MQQIAALIPRTGSKPKRTTERGELLEYFLRNVNADRGGRKPLPIGAIAAKLAHLKVGDLYYMRSTMTDIERRSGTVAAVKWFWWSINPKKHNTEN